MNLTNRPVTPKGMIRKSRGVSRRPNAEEKKLWERIAALGCILVWSGFAFQCKGHTTLHHCGTGAGGRKDHLKVIPLCFEHHLGALGIDGKRMSKREWQQRYGTEEVLLTRVKRKLEKQNES